MEGFILLIQWNSHILIHDRIQGKIYNPAKLAFIKSVVYQIPTLHVMFDEVGTSIKNLGPSQIESGPSTPIIL